MLYDRTALNYSCRRFKVVVPDGGTGTRDGQMIKINISIHETKSVVNNVR